MGFVCNNPDAVHSCVLRALLGASCAHPDLFLGEIIPAIRSLCWEDFRDEELLLQAVSTLHTWRGDLAKIVPDIKNHLEARRQRRPSLKDLDAFDLAREVSGRCVEDSKVGRD